VTSGRLTILCIATYEKGHEFIRECHRLGHRVLLITADILRDADWPREAIEETFYIPRAIPREDLLKGVSHLARHRVIDRIVPLDDFDVETAALLREHLRIPGMGETTARYFRDKLAMRVKARNQGILVPEFVHVLNDAQIEGFMRDVPPPWVLKPRSSAAAIGVTRIGDADALWAAIETLGDNRSFHLLERYVPGDVYHVDSIVWERDVLFDAAHKYGAPPMDVAHGGGVFTTRSLAREASERRPLSAINREVISTFGLVRGVAHTEFIRAADDGRWYFLETAARVGGAFIVDMIEAASGLNLWREWAHVEIAGEDTAYHPPAARDWFSGLVLTLAREERPDTSAYEASEIVRRIDRPHHAGLIVASEDSARIDALVDDYAERFRVDFMASMPAPETPTA
jgi:biotin carboxylase